MLLEHQSAIIYGGGGGIGGGPETRPGPTARPPPGCRGRGPARHDGRGRQQRPPGGPGDTEFRASRFDVLRIEGDRIAEITTFDATLFPAFGLPPTL